MRTPLERIFAGLSASERMAVLIAGMTAAAMVSAVAADRLLQQRSAPVVIAVDAADLGLNGVSALDAGKEVR